MFTHSHLGQCRGLGPRRKIRISMVGTGTVGRWLLRSLHCQRESLDVEVSLVSLANSREHVHSEGEIDVAEVLEILERGGRLSELGGVEPAATSLPGLRSPRADLLVDVSKSPRDGEPALGHLRRALEDGVPVVTSNKWPVAVAGVELTGLAREQGVGFRAESTVMSGTPLLSSLTTGIGGAAPIRLRGVVNATVNQICTWMDDGVGYQQALSDAQAAGLAEPDPSEDVSGLDSVAKVMILSALVFGERLTESDVERDGVSSHSRRSSGGGETRVREVATLDPGIEKRSVQITELEREDPLFDVSGRENAVCLEASPIGRVIVRGPGAGPELAGQGVLSDLLALSREIALR